MATSNMDWTFWLYYFFKSSHSLFVRQALGFRGSCFTADITSRCLPPTFNLFSWQLVMLDDDTAKAWDNRIYIIAELSGVSAYQQF